MQGLTHKERGFTFIELVVVVAIIGILAAIAMSQFMVYRNKAFNAAAESDLSGARLAEETLFINYGVYGGTVAASGTAGSAAGVLLTQNGYVATTTANQQVVLKLTRHVRLQVKTTATHDAATITAKHDDGDRFYAMETDVGGVYSRSGAVGTAMVASDAVGATNDSAHSDAVAAGYTPQ